MWSVKEIHTGRDTIDTGIWKKKKKDDGIDIVTHIINAVRCATNQLWDQAKKKNIAHCLKWLSLNDDAVNCKMHSKNP